MTRGVSSAHKEGRAAGSMAAPFFDPLVVLPREKGLWSNDVALPKLIRARSVWETLVSRGNCDLQAGTAVPS